MKKLFNLIPVALLALCFTGCGPNPSANDYGVKNKLYWDTGSDSETGSSYLYLYRVDISIKQPFMSEESNYANHRNEYQGMQFEKTSSGTVNAITYWYPSESDYLPGKNSCLYKHEYAVETDNWKRITNNVLWEKGEGEYFDDVEVIKTMFANPARYFMLCDEEVVYNDIAKLIRAKLKESGFIN